MEEEPNEHELEERLYAMLHHVDETQANVNTDTQNDPARLVENAPRSTVRRYWRTNTENARTTNPYPKVNTPNDSVPAPVSKNPTTTNTNNTKPKEQKNEKPEPAVDLSLFQSPPQIVKRTIEILEHENQSFVLESSDEDEVIEVELPPKPTITIESSDEDDVSIVSKPETPSKDQPKNNGPGNATPATAEREISTSPVPSVVSSVSDDFIRGDCIALNISSRHPDNHSFDFSLHGSDLLGQVTPSKKKKKKKSKEAITSTPIRPATEKPSNVSVDTCFATPKSKAKNKKQKAKSYSVSEKSLPSADVYDSDSNQSAIEPIKDQAANDLSEKIIPNSAIYESDASLLENKTDKSKPLQNDHGNKSLDVSLDQSNKDNKTKNSKKNDTTAESYKTADSIVDLTDSDNYHNYITLDRSDICENIVMANVTGFKESEDYGDKTSNNDAPKFGSTKVPQILFEDLDFDNLKGKDKVCKRRKYSLTTLRAEMEKFYNESWGGEDFNHREIQKYMSRDKNLWVIDPKDRMPSLSKRKVTCNYCNRPGHRDDTCRQKPPVCHMCGSTGHYEPRCPSKICVNCGSPNFMYSTMCRNCATWDRVTCAECGQGGHPSSHCPDVWRRYHNTISMNMPLAENRQIKRNSQLYCSGCTRRGHLVHACRSTLPFSGLPLNSPYVAFYRPVFVPTEEEPDQPRRQHLNKTFPQDSATITQRNKRQSKSPMHEAHINKKKNMTITEIGETPEKQKTNEGRQRKYSQGKNQPEENKAKELGKSAEVPKTQPATVEPALDFIPISTNTDKQGQMIQDNEVSDTSDVVTSARIYVTPEIIHKLKTPEGQYWLNEHMLKHDVTVQSSDINSFLSIKGKFADQEAFQNELREWSKPTTDKENPKSDTEGDVTFLSEHEQQHSSNIPKQRNTVLRKISKALESLKNDLGDPKDIYKELNFLQNKHDHLLQQKVISPKQLNNNRDHINIMLKKLNMVLLGQAGLADGSEHLNELHSLREKLTHFRQKSISLNMRREIGKHYHSIFTPIPRNDYADLLNMYYVARNDKILNKRNHKLQMVTKKRKRQRKNINPVAAAQNQTFPSIDTQDGNKNVVQRQNTHSKKNAEHISMKKLTYFHRRVMNTRPADSVLKKTRMDLARKLHTHIASLNRNEKMSSKTMKKVKRIQEQAALFLNNV